MIYVLYAWTALMGLAFFTSVWSNIRGTPDKFVTVAYGIAFSVSLGFCSIAN